MKDDTTMEKMESILRKINWAQNILESAQDSTDDAKMADILSGVSFIINSASSDAENVYRLLRW